MQSYAIEYGNLNERQLRTYIRASLLHEYRETQKIRLLNEGIFDFFSDLGNSLFGDIKGKVSTAVVSLLQIDPGGVAARAVESFFKKTGIKEIVNILMGKTGCKGTLLLFTNTLVDLIVKDIPKTLGLDPKGKFTVKLQTVFGEPAKTMADKLAEGLCNMSWSTLLDAIPGMSSILPYLGGGEKEGEKPSEEVIAAASADQDATAIATA